MLTGKTSGAVSGLSLRRGESAGRASLASMWRSWGCKEQGVTRWWLWEAQAPPLPMSWVRPGPSPSCEGRGGHSQERDSWGQLALIVPGQPQGWVPLWQQLSRGEAAMPQLGLLPSPGPEQSQARCPAAAPTTLPIPWACWVSGWGASGLSPIQHLAQEQRGEREGWAGQGQPAATVSRELVLQRKVRLQFSSKSRAFTGKRAALGTGGGACSAWQPEPRPQSLKGPQLVSKP